MVKSIEISVPTSGDGDTKDITEIVEEAIAQSGLDSGIVTVFVPGSTAGLSTIEYEDGVVGDLADAVQRVAPSDIPYAHNARWGDGNGHAHVRAALIGPSLTIPFTNAKPMLGTWQQVVLLDFDNRPRQRRLILQMIGE